MKDQEWSHIISSEKSKKKVFGELINYFDLITLFVKRDFAKEFKQTILGPLWFVAQPIFQTIVLILIFGKIGKMGPEGIPMISFYLGGTMLWTVFSENLIKTSETFRANSSIFSKVYFPRLVLPISGMLTQLLKLGIQFIIFITVYLAEYFTSDSIVPNFTVLFFPFYILASSIIGMSFGLVLCSLTTKYWDLRFLIQFGIQLLMFLSTVVVPVSALQNGTMKTLIMLNPISSLIEAFRFGFLGSAGGSIEFVWLLYSFCIAILFLIVGIKLFGKVENSFIDSI